MSINILQV